MRCLWETSCVSVAISETTVPSSTALTTVKFVNVITKCTLITRYALAPSEFDVIDARDYCRDFVTL